MRGEGLSCFERGWAARAVVWLSCLLASACLVGPVHAAAAERVAPQLDADAWLLIDASDGAELASEDASRMLPIASATKLMTAYVALKKLPLDKRLSAPPYAALGPESLLGLQAGERVSVRDLLFALIMASANDGAVALAEGVSGSVDRFVALMNRTARRLGLEQTSYANPIGLDAPGSGSSARDLSVLARELLDDPLFRRIADAEQRSIETDVTTRTIENRNSLLYGHPWVDGIKTGYTLGAGYVLVGSGTREGVTLVSVILGAPTESERDAETLELLDYGFSLYRRADVVRKGRPIVTVPVDSGVEVPLVAETDAVVAVRRGQGVETEIEAPEELEGPVSAGETLGKVRVLVAGRRQAVVPLAAQRSAPAPSIAQRFRESLGFPLWAAVAGLGLIVILIVMAMVLQRRKTREA